MWTLDQTFPDVWVLKNSRNGAALTMNAEDGMILADMLADTFKVDDEDWSNPR